MQYIDRQCLSEQQLINQYQKYPAYLYPQDPSHQGTGISSPQDRGLVTPGHSNLQLHAIPAHASCPVQQQWQNQASFKARQAHTIEFRDDNNVAAIFSPNSLAKSQGVDENQPKADKKWWSWRNKGANLKHNLAKQFNGRGGYNGHFLYKPTKSEDVEIGRVAPDRPEDYGGSVKVDPDGKYLLENPPKTLRYKFISHANRSFEAYSGDPIAATRAMAQEITLRAGCIACWGGTDCVDPVDGPQKNVDVNGIYDIIQSLGFANVDAPEALLAPGTTIDFLARVGDGYEETTRSLIEMTEWAVVTFFFVAIVLSICGPVSVRGLYGGQVLKSAILVGFEGVMPINKLERLVLGNNDNRLTYEAASTYISTNWRDHDRRVGKEPDWVKEGHPWECGVPKGDRLFTLVDTGPSTITIFSAERPPTVALLCGREGGMLRAVLCSW
ncbi:hypothetical protein GQX73_g1642 [Xylaria multiplex]|uniref:Uncharacterized protein n=1 Tax=Xylaria multiplex TaxID=323545 RepID=A0A7C8N9Q4_9PEZI|nr:hypothetical protein GQX73_g1642 [Xylaria multiplex]